MQMSLHYSKGTCDEFPIPYSVKDLRQNWPANLSSRDSDNGGRGEETEEKKVLTLEIEKDPCSLQAAYRILVREMHTQMHISNPKQQVKSYTTL